MQIHPSSVISKQCKIGKDVKIGPFCIIESNVEIGNGCRLEGRVTVKEGTTIGDNNLIFEGTVIGGLPQHIAVHDVESYTLIGNGNTIRENCTIHRAMKEGMATTIGDGNLFMVNVHVAHDCHVGNNSIMANNSLLAGHVSVGSKVNISGAVGVHQFCRIGDYAMVGGQSHVTQDVPPYVLVDGFCSGVVGLNLIGLRRAGFPVEDIKQLKAAYRILYNSELTWREILAKLEETFDSGPALEMTRFLSSTTRGILPERRKRSKTLLKIHHEDDFSENIARDDEFNNFKVG